MVAVDQLEELFTACDGEAERARFLERLAAAARDHERRVLVLCALRADFYGRLGAYPRFAELLSRSHVLVGPMDREELTRGDRTAGRSGRAGRSSTSSSTRWSTKWRRARGLPLLSTTLLELWRARNGRVLRLDDYRASGGVRGGVARIAEAA